MTVYWIRDPSHTTPLTEGYIGVSINLQRRIQEHRKEKWFMESEYVVEVLATYDEECAAYQHEEQLRPTTNIGWNLNKGGIRPPVNNRKGVPLPLWSNEQKAIHSVRMKKHYQSGHIQHWTKRYSAEEVSRKISAGDPGKSNRGKLALNRTQIEETTQGVIYSSQSEAAACLNIRQGDIANCLSGRQQSAKGFKFKYI